MGLPQFCTLCLTPAVAQLRFHHSHADWEDSCRRSRNPVQDLERGRILRTSWLPANGLEAMLQTSGDGERFFQYLSIQLVQLRRVHAAGEIDIAGRQLLA